MTGKFKVGDKVRVLPGGVDGDHGGIDTPMPFDTTVTVLPGRWNDDYRVENPDGGYDWFVPEEFLVPLGGGSEEDEPEVPGEEVVWASEPLTEWYEVRHDGQVLNRCETYGPARRVAEEWVRQNWWARADGVQVVKVTNG